jgi:sugar transferase (PEP-CTERM/EpsH1 system associated)
VSTILRAPKAAQRDGTSSVTGGRVLVVANRLPYPLDDGWKRRTFHILKGIAARRSVVLVTLHDGGAEEVERFLRAIDGDVEVVTVESPKGARLKASILGFFTREPYHVLMLRSPRLRREIRNLVEHMRVDIAIATLVHLFPYLDCLAGSAVRIVDTHNIDSLVLTRYGQRLTLPLKRLYSRITARKLWAHEARVFAQADRVWVCSEPEIELVLARSPHARISVIPNGVDADGEFAPAQSAPSPERLLFFGKLDYTPNEDAVEHFVRDIFPRIREQVPNVEFWAVGPGARSFLRALLDRSPGCRWVGPVRDLGATIASAAVVVVPLRMGGGTRLKILESMAVGRPVVSTPAGAEGLAFKHGEELELAEAPDRFANAVVRFLRDPDSAARLGTAGQRKVRQSYHWAVIEAQVANQLEQLRAVPERSG